MEEKYPVRINKYLALQKICSRHEADVLIAEGKVKINGRRAVLGDKVNATDKVEVAKTNKKLIYIALNKPKGIITEEIMAEGPERSRGIYPLGRLDKDSTGLIILTNDGRITDRLLSPAYDHAKEYIVKTGKPIDGLFVKKMSEGVKLDDGYITKVCKVNKIASNRFSIVLTEGKKHQIRRMAAALGYTISDLKRVRIMNIKLGSLLPGDHRELKGKELSDFLKSLGL